MVSLATYDDAVSPEVPSADPASISVETSTISTSRAFQFSAPSISEPSLAAPGQLNQAAPTPHAPSHHAITARAHVADSSGVLKLLEVEAAQLSRSSRSQIQLDLTVDSGDAVRIRLNLRGNDLFTTIATDSVDLREALQKSWPEFLSNQKDRPYRFAESQFQDSFNAPDQRNPRRQTPFESPEDSPSALSAKPRTARPVQITRSNQPVQLWA
jgi:hypothetical protein